MSEPNYRNIGGNGLSAFVVLGLFFLLALVSKAMVVVVLIITFIVFMHESGHYLAARATGMKATEFFLGFGPRLFSFRRGETEFGVKPVLAGAYVKIIGMTNLDEVDPIDEPRTYRQKSYPKRLLVASAGSLMHFAMAFVAMFILLSVFGEPKVEEGKWEVGLVVEESPEGDFSSAAEAGIRSGDRILALGAQSTVLWEDLVAAVRSQPGVLLPAAVERDGEVLELLVELDSTENGEGRLGISAQAVTSYETVSPLKSIVLAFSRLAEMAWQSLRGIWHIASNFGDVLDRIFSAPNDPTVNENLETRPLSLIGAVQIGASEQFNNSERLLLFISFNMFVGVFNLLPLLPLDGGHLLVASYERVREGRSGKRYMVDISRLMPITYVVIIFLAFFGIGAIYLDIANPLNF
jgi:membrane-associated protease RseP (regulator of RpoE activity)